jgi:hypothetical protein
METDLKKFMTVENFLKVVLAIAIGVMLYRIFFAKETFYNSANDKSGYAYPMDYEEEMNLSDDDNIDFTGADSGEDIEYIEYNEDVEDVEDVVDAEDDIYEYADTENEPYDDSQEIVTEVTEDAEDDMMYVYEEDVVDEEQDDVVNEIQNFDLMYASDVEDGLKESFMLYSNLVGVDTNYA